MPLTKNTNSVVVLEQLQTIIDRAEAGSDFTVEKAEVQFSAAVIRTAGVKPQNSGFYPKTLPKPSWLKRQRQKSP